jgi:NAD(P)H-flavin reductase
MSEIKTKPIYTAKVYDCKVTNINHLTDSTFLITFEKPNFEFASGQHIIVSLPGDLHDREYSICSAEDEAFLQIIVKEVKDGYFSPILKKVKAGDILKIRGPHGRFCLNYLSIEEKPIIMIATGTGIAPFRSMYKSYPNLKFSIIHGVKNSKEAYFKDEFKEDYKLCISQEKTSNSFQGRVTHYVQDINFDTDSIFYLCGNFNMIYDVQNILTSKGHSLNSIFTEVYF